MMYRITAPHFVAGVVFNEDKYGSFIVDIAPILWYMNTKQRGWSIEEVKEYCDRKSWTIEEIKELDAA